ncbi:DedA family protein [Cryptosporangium japonicum]|uniref:VTT domain-containing protein n=1 Tax=Cryptosporangium japonicum TaxID=80872 RepID=A0ABP3DWR2_9ACTN
MTSAEVPPLLQSIAPVLDQWGYLAVFAIVVVESFGVPAPGQTLMIAAAIYASSGHLNVWLVALLAFAAAVIGDNIGYWIGRKGGRSAVHRWGRYVFLTPERFAKAEQFFARRGGRVVLIARFIDGLRQFNGVIAGVTAMPQRTFLRYNAAGAALWVGGWVGVSYLFGDGIVGLLQRLHGYGWLALGLGAVLAAGSAWALLRRSRRPIPVVAGSGRQPGTGSVE